VLPAPLEEFAMADITSYIKLSPKEAVLDSWNVVEHRERQIGEKVAIGAGVFILMYLVFREVIGLVFFGLGVVTEGHIYELFTFAPFRALVLLITLLIPTLWVAYPLVLKPRVHGQLALTNWRLLYVSQGQALRRNVVNVTAINLADVLGVHSVYTENVLRRGKLKLVIYTRFHDGLVLETDESHSRIGRLPLVGDPFARDSITPETVAMLPQIFAKIQQRTGASIGSTGSY
jgi:hypothetical protein